ncbi:translation initiation factor IF-2-like [Coturnix japonica]|uniref:translation initiation factor IF-2-like n=1 Tax=Coturnix japonica TaxID=93934 RepID=UPI000777A0D0|nr:translation initiation factor IF-2-like [Coturnix japonica]
MRSAGHNFLGTGRAQVAAGTGSGAGRARTAGPAVPCGNGGEDGERRWRLGPSAGAARRPVDRARRNRARAGPRAAGCPPSRAGSGGRRGTPGRGSDGRGAGGAPGASLRSHTGRPIVSVRPRAPFGAHINGRVCAAQRLLVVEMRQAEKRVGTNLGKC